jgi:hypothetical protein
MNKLRGLVHLILEITGKVGPRGKGEMDHHFLHSQLKYMELI